ncbi:MAG TPA: response regulator [Puia sp.]|nr:response regulator [Puia sp.]
MPYLLIADDDQDDLDIFTEAFVRDIPGYHVEHAPGGKAALQFLDKATELPLVLILDYQMPDLNGPDVLRHLAADSRYEQMTKVMWSTSRRIKDMEDCKKLGATHYLIKPGDNKELSHMIHQMTTILDSAARRNIV